MTYLYEPDSYVPLARIDTQPVQAANDESIDAAQPANVYYFHNDVSGLPEKLTDVEGQVVWQAEYPVWGSNTKDRIIAVRVVNLRPTSGMPFDWQYLPLTTHHSSRPTRGRTERREDRPLLARNHLVSEWDSRVR